MSGPNVGFATVSIIPSARGFQQALTSTLDRPLAEAGRSGGRKATEAIEGELKNIRFDARQFAALGTALTAAGVAGAAGLFRIGDAFQQLNREIIVGTGASGAALESLNESARNIGQNTASSISDVGTAVADLNTRLGLTGVPLEDIANQFLDLSRLTGTDISQNIESVTRLLGDWGVAAGDASATLDQLFVASQNTGVAVDRLAQTVVTFGTTFRELGFSLEEATSLVGEFERVGVNTEAVLADLRVGLRRLGDAGEEPADAFRRVVGEIENATTASEANRIASENFGRAFIDVSRAIREGRFDVEELVAILGTSEGALSDTASAAETAQERIAKSFNRLLVAAEPLAGPTFDAIDGITEKLASFSEKFDNLPPGFQQFAGRIVAIGTGATIAAGGLALLTAGVLKASSSFAALTAATTTYTGAAGRAAIATRGLTTALLRLTGVAAAVVLPDFVLSGVNDLTGASEEAGERIDRLRESLQGGTVTVEEFNDALGAAASQLGFFDKAGDVISGVFDGGNRILSEFGEFGTTLAVVRRELDNIAESQGASGLRSLDAALRQQRASLEEGSDAWRQFGFVIDEVQARIEGAGGSGSGPFGADSYFGRVFAAGREAAVELGGAADAGEDFASVLEQVDRNARLASLGIETSAVAARSFADALERSSGAGLLRAGLGAGAALRDLRDGFFPDPVEGDRAAAATQRVERQVDRLGNAVSQLNPQLSASSREFGALSAAASAFSESIAQSTGLDDQIGSALNLSSAFEDFRRTFRRLPADLDVANISLGRLRPRQREAIQNLLQLGEAGRGYLATLLETGAGTDRVRQEANRLRAEFVEQFKQLNLNEEQVQKYLEILGLTPEQVETAITLSGAEEARFKLEALLQLLQGRISTDIAVDVATLIESGQIEAAVAKLGELARRNPPVIEIETRIDEPRIKGQAGRVKELFEFPESFDPLTAALGRYTEAQENALNAALDLGEAARNYLTELVGRGEYDTARENAAQLRERYKELFVELGASSGAAEDLVNNLIGIGEQDVEAAIRIAGFDAAVFQLQFLRDLLTDEDGSGIPSELELEIAAKVANDDFIGAANDLKAFTELRAFGLSPADAEIAFRLGIDTEEAAQAFLDFTSAVDASTVTTTLDADSRPAASVFTLWQRLAEGTSTQTPLDADDAQARTTLDLFKTDVENEGVVSPFDVDVSPALRSINGLFAQIPGTNFPILRLPGRQFGGPVQAGQPYVVGEAGAELFVPSTNGEILNQDQLGRRNNSSTINLTVNQYGVEARTAPEMFVIATERIMA